MRRGLQEQHVEVALGIEVCLRHLEDGWGHLALLAAEADEIVRAALVDYEAEEPIAPPSGGRR